MHLLCAARFRQVIDGGDFPGHLFIYAPILP